MADPFAPQQLPRNYIDDLLDQAQQDLELERKRQEAIITSEEPDKVLGSINKVEKQIENESPEVQRSVLNKAYNPGYFDRGVRGGNINRPTQQENKPLVKPGLNPGEVGQWQGFINAIKSGYKQGQQARNVIGLEGGLEAEERLKEIASLQAEIRGIPRSKAYNEFNEAKSFGEALKKLALDPIEITSQLVVESMASFLPTQIAGMMTGAGIGAGVGSIVPGIGTVAGAGSGFLYGGITSAGLTSLGMEYSGKMLEVMEELGVNTEDPNDLARGFSDNTIMSEARELGLRKGVPIAIFDLVSAGVAGRFMKPGKTLASKLVQGSKEVGTQAVLGSSGEAVGQLSAGEEIQPSAIIAEGIAEIGQSAPSGATRIATQKFKTQKQEKAKAKGIEALESGQLKNLSDQEIIDFTKSLTPEERLEVGVTEDGQFEKESDLGKEIIRRNIDNELQSRVDAIETEQDVRKLASEMNIKQQQKEGTDFVGKLISKAESESGVTIEREYLDRTLADEIKDEELSDERVQEILTEHGISEDVNPEDLMVVGRTSGGVIRISTAGTTDRMADEFVAVSEEMSEVFYNAEVENRGEEFENEITEERKNYHEATGEADTGESNQEWFSSMAVRFATQGKVHQSIGARLRDVFNRFVAQAKLILRDSFRLRKAIREGKVPESLIQKLEQATDFKTVGKKVNQVKNIKQKDSYRITAKNKEISIHKDEPKPSIDKKITESDIKKVEDCPPGRCFRNAHRTALLNEDIGARVIQGDVFMMRHQKRLPHAWVEMGDIVYDPTIDVIADKEKFYNSILEPKIINDLSVDESSALMLHKGFKLYTPEDILSIKDAGVLKQLQKRTQPGKVQQVAKAEGRKATPDGGVTYRISEVGKVDPVGVFVIGADMVARDLDGKLNPFGLRYTENFQGFQLSKAGATKLVKNGREGFNTVAVIAYDDIKGSQLANPSFQNRVKEKLAKAIGKRRLNKLLKENDNNVQVISGIVNKEIQEANKNKAKKDKKEKINLTQIARDNAEPDSPQLRRKIIYVGTLKEIRTGKDRFEKHDVYPAEQIFDTLVELKEPIPIDDLIADLPDTDMRKKNWGMMVTQTNFMMTADESNVSKQLMEMAEIGQDVFTGTPNPDYQFFSRETETITPGEAVDRSEGERQFKARQFVSQLDEELGLGTATRSSVGFTEEYGDEPSMVTRFFGKQDPEVLEYRGALTGLMFDQIDVTTFIGDPDGKDSLLKITIPKTDLRTLKDALTFLGVENKTIRSRGNKQDILLWNFGDIDVNFIHAIAEKYNYENYSEENGEFRFITAESRRETARKRFIKIVQDYQSKTNKSLPKTFNKFLPDFYSRKADRDKLQKQLKAKPKPSYRIAPTFYSKAERVVTDKFPPTMKSQSVENFLKKNQVKPEEIEWLDLESLLKGKLKITKEELQEWIQANKIEIKDVTFGQYIEDPKAKKQLVKLTEYESYQLPGEKEDYRELLLIYPGTPMSFEQYKINELKYREDLKGKDEILKARYKGYLGQEDFTGDPFSTRHWDHYNVLAHVRFNTRISPTGERVLFIEELQSDWHKEGREKGYKENLTELPEGYTVKKWKASGEYKILEQSLYSDRPSNFFKTKNRYQIKNPFGGSASGVFTTEKSAIKDALKNLNTSKVPNAPFKGNGWIELIMKRMLRHASDNNFDRIAWTTSNQQIDRWKNDLRQNVDQIQWQKITKEFLDDYIEETGDTGTLMDKVTDQYANTVIINGLKNKENKFNQTIPLEGETTINGQRVTLEGLLGKQMATQIRNSNKRTGIIEGDDLTIGGQGFKVVYDVAIKKILNKMGKKFGASVDQIKLEIGESVEPRYFKYVTQPSIRITNLMKDSVQKGQPTFRITEMAEKNVVTPLSKVYQEQKGDKKSYTKKDFEQDLAKLGYSEDMIKTAKDLFGIIRIKQIETTEPTPIEKELKKLQERQITQSEIKNRIKRAYKLGANEKEKEITKLQKIVTNYARKNLPTGGSYLKSELTGLLAKVRDAKRFRELRTAMERIDRVIDNVSKRSALAKFNKVIKKKAKIKKVGGIGRGKVGAEVQGIVDQVREVHKMSPVEVEERLEVITKIIDANQDGEPTDQQSVDINILMQYGGIKNKTPQQIAEATESLDALITKGRMQIIDEQQAYGERMSVVRQKILDVITGGKGKQSEPGMQKLGIRKKGAWQDTKDILSGIDNINQSIEYIFDKLSRFDKDSKPLESFINEYFMPMIRQARIAEYNGVVEMHNLINENASRIFGVKGKKLVKLLNDNTKNTIEVNHHDGVSKEGIKGEFITSTLTYNEAYKKWMELQDPTLYKTFEKMGWDVQKAIDQIEKQLPDKVLEWAKWQLYEFYPMYYARVNETFRRRFYVNMPMNPMYSPISRRVGSKADEGDDTLNKSKSPMGSVSSAGSLKGRVSNTKSLTYKDGDSMLMRHITEMEHFIHYTDVMRELRSVFMTEDISQSIRDFHGDNISQVLNRFIDDIARGGVDRSLHIDIFDRIRANFSRGVIGANPVVFVKQLASIPAYIADIPASFWTKEFLKVFNPIEFRKMTKIISKSEVLKMRYDKGFDRDMRIALQNIKPGKMITGENFFNNAMYALTKLGDKQAIYLGGYPVYKYHLKQALKAGKSRKEAEQFAMKKFEQATLRSQQASDIEDLSQVQRMGTFAKFLTMFMTSPNQYYRMVAGGYRNLYYGRGSKVENFRKIFVGQILLPSLFTFISNGFEFDEKEQITSIFLFPFAGLLVFGQGVEYLVRSALAEKVYPMGTIPVLDPFENLGRGVSKFAKSEKIDSKKAFEIANEFLEGAGKVTGIPYGSVRRSVKGVMKVAKGESEAPVRQIIGFNMGTKKKKDTKKKKKKKKQLF